MSTERRTSVEVMLSTDDGRREFAQERLVFEATEMIAKLMEEKNVSRADLARKIGKSKAFITQVLSGSRNMTLGTIAELVYALGGSVQLSCPSLIEEKISEEDLRDLNCGWIEQEQPLGAALAA